MSASLTPSWEAPDWLIVIRTTLCDGEVQREAAAECYRRKLWLSCRPEHSQVILDRALVAGA